MVPLVFRFASDRFRKPRCPFSESHVTVMLGREFLFPLPWRLLTTAARTDIDSDLLPI